MLISIICQIADKAVQTNDVDWKLYWFACSWQNNRLRYAENSVTLKLLLQEEQWA